MVLGSTEAELLTKEWADRAEESEDDEGEDDGDYEAGDEGEEEVCTLSQLTVCNQLQKQNDLGRHPPQLRACCLLPDSTCTACTAYADSSKAAAPHTQRVRLLACWC